MLHETVLYLLMIGIFAVLVRNAPKYDSWLVSVLTGFTVLVFYLFLSDWHLGTESGRTFAFQNAQNDNLKLDIISQKQNYALVFPFFVGTILTLLNNLLLKFEEHKKRFLGLSLFNLTALIMLISGNNLIQLMTFVFVIDIITFLLIENVQAARRYSLYNLVSDMGLFLVLSMIQGKLINLDVGNIAHYYETGHHRDFIMFVVCISLFIKFGLSLFQGYWNDLKNVKFHRLYFLPYLSTPMVGLILFIKLYPILVVSPSFLPFLNTILILSMIFGALGAVLMPSIKEKFVYFNMLQISLLIKLVEKSGFIWNSYFSNLLIFFFMFNLCLYTLHYVLTRQHPRNKVSLIYIIGIFVINIISIFLTLAAVKSPDTKLWIICYILLFALSVSYMLTRFYPKLKVLSQNTVKSTDFHLFLLMAGELSISFYFCRNEISNIGVIFGSLIFLGLLFFLNPLKYITLSESFIKWIQNTNFSVLLYKKLIVLPLKHVGILSNILIDFIFLERTLWPIINKVSMFVVKFYRVLSLHYLMYYTLCIGTGIAIILYVLR